MKCISVATLHSLKSFQLELDNYADKTILHTNFKPGNADPN